MEKITQFGDEVCFWKDRRDQELGERRLWWYWDGAIISLGAGLDIRPVDLIVAAHPPHMMRVLQGCESVRRGLSLFVYAT